MPTTGNKDAAGADVYAAVRVLIPSKGHAIVPLGFKLTAPEGTYARLAPRSGLATTKMIDVGAGAIDRDYHGECRVVIVNIGDHEFLVKVDDRIAQLIFEKISPAEFVEGKVVGPSDRGAAGFGSTGVSERSGEAVAATSDAGSVPSIVPV